MILRAMIVRAAGAFAAVVAFSLILDVPRKLVPYAGFTGAMGWLLYLFMENGGHSLTVTAFASAMLIAMLSNIFARKLKAPASVFLVPGILPSVPGGSIYRCVYCLIENNRAMSNYYFAETLQIAGAIAMAIFITDSFVKLFLGKR